MREFIVGSEPSHLDAKELLAGARPAAVIDNRAFVPGPAVRPARAPFEGDLVLSEAAMQTVPADLKLRAMRGKDARYFPAVRLSFIAVDGDLVPATQDVIRTGFAAGGRSYWDLIVQYPGGLTGIRIAHLPADSTTTDDPTPMARVANRLAPFCK